MNRSRKRQEGLKLIELLLAMVIGASIFYFSMQQYLSYRRDADVAQVRYNVDLIFRAMASYFHANCRTSAPLNTSYTNTSYAVTLDDLKEQGFFTAQLTRSPLIQQNSAEEGYILQFNQVRPPPTRQQSFSMGPTTPVQQITIGSILIWKAQVAVALKNPATSLSYLPLLQADCLSELSSSGGSTVVTPCAGSSTSNAPYAVFTRLPSFSSSQANSPFWSSMPIVRQFTQRYYTYPVIIKSGNQSLYANQQFFVCGT